jgi:hypothetical protein
VQADTGWKGPLGRKPTPSSKARAVPPGPACCCTWGLGDDLPCLRPVTKVEGFGGGAAAVRASHFLALGSSRPLGACAWDRVVLAPGVQLRVRF